MTSRDQMLGGEVQVNATNVDMYVFAFAPASAGTPTGVTSRRDGMIKSIVYGGATGLYTVTLQDGYPGTFLGGHCAVLSTSAGNMRGYSAEFDGTNAATGVLSIAVYNTSNALANVTAGTGETVLVTAYFSKSPISTL